MKLYILAFVCICGAVSSIRLPKIPKVNIPKNDDTTKYIIFDTDVGSDDAWALFMLLKADLVGKIKILAITCVNGNTQVDNVTRNTIRILEFSNRTDIPVFRGAMNPFLGGIPPEDPPYNGYDGFGDVYNDQAVDMSLLQSENAVTAMYKIVKKYPKRVTLVATGPQTNVALAITTYSDFSENVKEIFVMGGNYHAIGNVSPTAEFNFFVDPEAAFIVFNFMQRPITTLPWEACLQENLNITTSWRFDVLGKTNSSIVKFMNPVEESMNNINGAAATWAPPDMLLVSSMLNPKAAVKRPVSHNATVELSGSQTRGQVVINRLNVQAIENVQIIELVDQKGIQNMVLWTVGEKQLHF